MDITVIIPSRGRSKGLSAVLYSLRYFESGKHNVRYTVACDDDDVGTVVTCQSFIGELPIAYRCGPREKSLGVLHNKMAELIPAEVYVGINDDILICTPNWDDKIAIAVEKTPYGVFWWKNAFDQETLYPIVTEKWRQAAGSIFTDYYPYWFDDLCLIELWVMATQQESLFLDIYVADKPVKTTRMRELSFWWKFYNATRKDRVKKAKEIAKNLGLPEPNACEAIAERLSEQLRGMTEARLNEIEAGQGESSPPDEAYLQAKERAKALMEAA